MVPLAVGGEGREDAQRVRAPQRRRVAWERPQASAGRPSEPLLKMSDHPKLLRFRYFARSPRHAGAEELVFAKARIPVASPGGPLKIGAMIFATAATLAEVLDDVALLGARPLPREKISRSTPGRPGRPGRGESGSAEAEAVAGRKPPH